MDQQPIWQLVGTLGDVSALDYDSARVFIDTTGVYDPELEVINITQENYFTEGNEPYAEVSRLIIEPCTYINGILSDNKYHPDNKVWFAKYLPEQASYHGLEVQDLIDMFISEDVMERAQAWLMLTEYHGAYELDQSPLHLTRDELANRLGLTVEA